MTYWGVNAYFLTGVGAVAVAALVVHRRRATRAGAQAGAPRRALGWAIASAILLVMTAVFDNAMIGIGLVGYDRAKISGVFIGVAPLEDFSYAVAALVLLPSVWVLVGPRRSSPASVSTGAGSAEARS